MTEEGEESVHEALEHSIEAGARAKDRVEELLEGIGGTLDHLTTNIAEIGERLAQLELHAARQAAEKTAETAHETAMDVAGNVNDAGNTAMGAVDVPGAVVEDVVHDTTEAASETSHAASGAAHHVKKSVFGRKR